MDECCDKPKKVKKRSYESKDIPMITELLSKESNEYQSFGALIGQNSQLLKQSNEETPNLSEAAMPLAAMSPVAGLHGGTSGATIGGLLGALVGHGRGNTAEGLGRGVIRGGMTGVGAGMGGALGASLGSMSNNPLIMALTGAAGAGAGGLGGYALGGKTLGKPKETNKKEEKREKESKQISQLLKQAAQEFKSVLNQGMPSPRSITPQQPKFRPVKGLQNPIGGAQPLTQPLSSPLQGSNFQPIPNLQSPIR